jgi:hypothetical protein
LKKEFKGPRDKARKKIRKKIENLKNNQAQKNQMMEKHVLQYANYYYSCMTLHIKKEFKGLRDKTEKK